ncbi:MAG: TIGR03435 family protein [Pseudomonadota bacterium]
MYSRMLVAVMLGGMLAVPVVAQDYRTNPLPNLSLDLPNAGQLGSKFFSTTITRNKEPLLAEAYYEDTQGNLIVQGASLATVIARAYDLQNYQVLDGPEWVYQPHLYDIKAAPPPTFIESEETEMVRAMLVDRFAFTAESKAKEVTMLVLVVDETATPFDFAAHAVEKRSGLSFRRVEQGQADVTATLDSLALSLSRERQQPVRNLTGMNATYAFTLKEEDFPPAVNFQMPLNQMLLQQLGLKVETRTIPLEVLAITHIEHPQLDPPPAD